MQDCYSDALANPSLFALMLACSVQRPTVQLIAIHLSFSTLWLFISEKFCRIVNMEWFWFWSIPV